MDTFITSQWFQIIGVTIISSGIGIFVKYVSRNDSHNKTFIKEDLAIGVEMMITALILLITYSVNQYNKLFVPNLDETMKISIQESQQFTPWIILVFFVGLWGTSTVIRKLGWENENELKIWWGIVFPNIIGIIALIYVFNWMRAI